MMTLALSLTRRLAGFLLAALLFLGVQLFCLVICPWSFVIGGSSVQSPMTKD
jgi:hypothetical protein